MFGEDFSLNLIYFFVKGDVICSSYAETRTELPRSLSFLFLESAEPISLTDFVKLDNFKGVDELSVTLVSSIEGADCLKEFGRLQA